MADWGTFKVGGTTYPLTASTSNSALLDSDPSIFYTLDYFGAMLVQHMGARFMAEVVKTGLKGTDGKAITSVVGSKLGYDPGPYLTQSQVKFPLLAAYRDNAVFSEKSVTHERDTTVVQVLYVLPPLSPGQAERLTPLLHSVNNILFERTEVGADPSYTPPGGTLGARVWLRSGMDMVGFTSARYTGFSEGSDLYFPAWQATLSIAELTDWVSSAFQNFSGADVHEDLRDDPTNTTILDVVQFASDVG